MSSFHDACTSIEIQVFNVLPPEPDLRDRATPEYLAFEQQLTDDIAARGQCQPIYVMRPEGGKFQVLTGWTRVLACRRAGRETVRAFVLERPMTEGEKEMEKLLENELQNRLTPLERAASYQRLMKANGWNKAELARHLPGGRDKKLASQVSKALAISEKLCPEVQAMVAAGEVPPRAAYAISRITEAAGQIELAKLVKDDVISVEGCEHRVQTTVAGDKRVKKQKPWIIKLANATAIIKAKEGIEGLIAALKRFRDRGEGPDPVPA